MRSTDGGVSWTRLPIPRYLGNVTSSVTLPGGKIVALCSHPAIIRMDSDGTSLTTLPLQNTAWITSDRMGDLFAYLNSTMIARSKDVGDTWDTIIGPSGESIYGISADEKDYYLATATGIYTSSDKGTTWRRCLNGLAVAIYYHILAGHNGHVWANGYAGGDGNDLFFSIDYGQHWTYAGSVDWHYGMVANDRNEVLLMEYSQETFAALFNDSSLKSISFGSSTSLFAADSSWRWLGASNGLPNLYEATDNFPFKWNPLLLPLSSPSFLFRAYSTVFTGSGSAGYIMNPPFGWKGLSGNNITPLGMDFFDTSMLGTSSGTNLLRSKDSGRTWSGNILGALPIGTVHVAAAAPNRIYAATNGVFFTDDAGKDWSETNDNILTGAVTALCADSSGRLYAACSGSLFSTSDEGNSWQKLTLPFPINSISNMRANRAGTVILCGTSDTVLRSEDDGANWQWEILPDYSAITDIYVSPASDVFASSQSGVYYWPVGSAIFYNASDGLDSIGVNALAADSAGNIYAATNGMGVWEGVGVASLLGVSEHSTKIADIAASPNPASSIVRFVLPSEGTWSVVAMDALGREWPMPYSVSGGNLECDLRMFPSGAYELVLRSGSMQTVSRVQVLR